MRGSAASVTSHTVGISQLARAFEGDLYFVADYLVHAYENDWLDLYCALLIIAVAFLR